MKALIVEDDYTSRTILRKLLMAYGDVEVAADGAEAISLFKSAREKKRPFDLICLDIMLPEKDGISVLKEIRSLEAASADDDGEDDQEEEGSIKPVRIIMTTALSDRTHVAEAIKHCDGYLVKPYRKGRLLQYLREFGLTAS